VEVIMFENMILGSTSMVPIKLHGVTVY